MSLSMTIFTMIAAWIAIALAMLWGILRIARRRLPVRCVNQPAPQQRQPIVRMPGLGQA
jgi:hypothetical protein